MKSNVVPFPTTSSPTENKTGLNEITMIEAFSLLEQGQVVWFSHFNDPSYAIPFEAHDELKNLDNLYGNFCFKDLIKGEWYF